MSGFDRCNAKIRAFHRFRTLQVYQNPSGFFKIRPLCETNKYKTMRIRVNDQPVDVAASITIEQLLQQLEQQKQGVALAINQQIVSRSEWTTHSLKDGDQITLIRATAGG